MTSYILFKVNFHTNFSEHIRIVGNCQQLGNWNPHEGLELKTTENAYPTWYS